MCTGGACGSPNFLQLRADLFLGGTIGPVVLESKRNRCVLYMLRLS